MVGASVVFVVEDFFPGTGTTAAMIAKLYKLILRYHHRCPCIFGSSAANVCIKIKCISDFLYNSPKCKLKWFKLNCSLHSCLILSCSLYCENTGPPLPCVRLDQTWTILVPLATIISCITSYRHHRNDVTKVMCEASHHTPRGTLQLGEEL